MHALVRSTTLLKQSKLNFYAIYVIFRVKVLIMYKFKNEGGIK